MEHDIMHEGECFWKCSSTTVTSACVVTPSVALQLALMVLAVMTLAINGGAVLPLAATFASTNLVSATILMAVRQDIALVPVVSSCWSRFRRQRHCPRAVPGGCPRQRLHLRHPPLAGAGLQKARL